MATIHISAKDNEFSDIVFMSGDPLRAKYIAETYLDNIKQVNKIRGMLAFTATYKGRKISIMGHGIGIPSCSIYVKELITNFNVKVIYRLGSCGAINDKIKLHDIIVAMGASTDSKINRIKFNNNDFAAIANFELINNIINVAKIKKINVNIGNIFTTDNFYYSNNELITTLKKYGILAIEMEAAGLYSIAAEHSIKAITICTVSDELHTGIHLSPSERETSFNKMIELALDSVLLLN